MSDLLQTSLHDLHVELGAKMVPFAGYSMPVQYPMGVMGEHTHCRTQAGLFDVSHMGQVWIDGPDWETIARGFERLVPQDVLGLKPWRQRYGFFTNDTGGIEDDLMFARYGEGDRLFVVVNAACKVADIARMRAALEPELTVTEIEDRALIAVQGPTAGAVCEGISTALTGHKFMDFHTFAFCGTGVMGSRSGYTGEDGFELSIHESQVEQVVRQLLADPRVAPVGLGARDSLRLEAGLCLYGNDMDAGLNPVEASLSWAIQKVRRTGGARAGGFPGADVILDALDNGVGRHRVGLKPDGRAPMRQGVPLFEAPDSDRQIGFITSGGFGPSVGGPIAMGIVANSLHTAGTVLYGELRGKRLPLTVTPLPFIPANFKR